MTRPSLAAANQVRHARSELHAAVKAGEVTVPRLITEAPACLHTMRVLDLLQWQHRWGPDRTDRFLEAAGVSPHRTLGSLAPREREELAYKTTIRPLVVWTHDYLTRQ